MWSPSFVAWSLCISFFSLVSAQTYPITPMCPTYNGTYYTDPNNVTWTIYCGFDTSPGSTGTTANIPSFQACMNLCESTTGCQVVTYTTGGTCYTKPSFSNVVANSNLYSAVRYIPPPPYPKPQANYVNASTGCGLALPAGMSAGGGIYNQTFLAPDGTLRWYLMNIPSSYNISKAAPLIMAFHGRSSTPTAHIAESNWNYEPWNPYGISVFPNGVNVSTLVTSHGRKLTYADAMAK